MRDLSLAAVYGCIIALMLGAPNYRSAPPVSVDGTSPILLTGAAEIDGVQWGRWELSGKNPLLCPPGQQGYLVEQEPGESRLVCGFEPQPTAESCDSGRGVVHFCRADEDLKSFFRPQGLLAPEVFAGCCPTGKQPICRIHSDGATLSGKLNCGAIDPSQQRSEEPEPNSVAELSTYQ